MTERKKIDTSTVDKLKKSADWVSNQLVKGDIPVKEVRELRMLLLGMEKAEFHKLVAQIYSIETDFYDV